MVIVRGLCLIGSQWVFLGSAHQLSDRLGYAITLGPQLVDLHLQSAPLRVERMNQSGRGIHHPGRDTRGNP